MIRSITSTSVFLISLLIIFTGCNRTHKISAANQNPTLQSAQKAVAVIHPLKNSNVKGIVTFVKSDKGIKVTVDIEGLTPGKHGFHIHEFGDCSSEDGTLAGGHFNPELTPHAGPNAAIRHVGDLGNLIADENGKAHYEFVDDLLSFEGKHNIIGRGIIIHSGEDDLSSQPSGNSGSRIACGTIGIAKD